MALADKFVIITNLQFEKNEGWQQRHKIKSKNGDVWLTVPVLGSQNQLIRDVKINNLLNWQKKHKKTLQIVYAKTTEKDFLDKLLSIYDKDYDRLVDLNSSLISQVRDFLEIETPVIIDEEVSGAKHELLINVTKKHGGDVYLSGIGAKDYLDETRLAEIKKNNIEHRFVEKNLTAQYPYSTIHYLLSDGKDWVKNVIKG